MTEDQRRAILDEVRRYTGRLVLEQDEVTVSDVVQDSNLEPGFARKRLEDLVKDGVMTVRSGVYDPRCKKLVNAYSFVKGDDDG